MVSCSVDGCNSNDSCNCVKYFLLPKIEPDSSLWLKLLNKENCTEREKRHLTICSKHFLETDLVQRKDKEWLLREGACPVLVDKANFKDCSCNKTDLQNNTKIPNTYTVKNKSLDTNKQKDIKNDHKAKKPYTGTYARKITSLNANNQHGTKDVTSRYKPILPSIPNINSTTDPTYFIVLPSDTENSPTSNSSINKMVSLKARKNIDDSSTNKRDSSMSNNNNDDNMSSTHEVYILSSDEEINNDSSNKAEVEIGIERDFLFYSDDEEGEDFTILSKKRKKADLDKNNCTTKTRKRKKSGVSNHTFSNSNTKSGKRKNEVTFDVDLISTTNDKKLKSTVKSLTEINEDASTESKKDPRDNFKITLPYSSKNKNSSNANSAENLTSKPTSDMLSSLQLKPVSSNDGNNVNGKPAISTTNKDTESHNKAPSLVSQNKLGCLGSIVPGTQPISIATQLNKEVPQGMYILPNFSNATGQNTPTFIIPPMNNAIQPSGLQNGPVTLILPPQGPQVASNLPVVGSSLPVTKNTMGKNGESTVVRLRNRIKQLEYLVTVSNEKIVKLLDETKRLKTTSQLGSLRRRVKDLEFEISRAEEKIVRLQVKTTIQQKELKAKRSLCERLFKRPQPVNNTLQKMNLQPPLDDIIKKLVTGKEGHSLPIKQFSLALNFMSPDAYSFIRELFNNVLPHPSSLYEWNNNNKNTANNSMQGQNDLYEVEAFQSDSDSDNLDSMPTTSKNSEVTSTQVSSNDTLGQCLEYVGIHDL